MDRADAIFGDNFSACKIAVCREVAQILAPSKVITSPDATMCVYIDVYTYMIPQLIVLS